jgi:hypothetical protein
MPIMSGFIICTVRVIKRMKMYHALRRYNILVGKPERDGPLDIYIFICDLLNDTVMSSVSHPIGIGGLFPWGLSGRA